MRCVRQGRLDEPATRDFHLASAEGEEQINCWHMVKHCCLYVKLLTGVMKMVKSLSD